MSAILMVIPQPKEACVREANWDRSRGGLGHTAKFYQNPPPSTYTEDQAREVEKITKSEADELYLFSFPYQVPEYTSSYDSALESHTFLFYSEYPLASNVILLQSTNRRTPNNVSKDWEWARKKFQTLSSTIRGVSSRSRMIRSRRQEFSRTQEQEHLPLHRLGEESGILETPIKNNPDSAHIYPLSHYASLSTHSLHDDGPISSRSQLSTLATNVFIVAISTSIVQTLLS
ncbi:hypothetical protein B0O99DRAFT_591052 [Bisporella sp. PMI_857]|nr:hypothetical protein B0O99DRAFT_591052 [Bisporella sp. PMI_857]